jgi:transcriptional regulator with XRE-family HTH domain
MLSPIRRSPPKKAEPGAIRATREAFGWSQERLAEEMDVLPAEIAAWESGAIALDPHNAEVMRWRMEHAEYLARLPRSECYWTRANRDRLRRMEEVGPYSGRQAQREIAAHERECAECLRLRMQMMHVPPPPEPPVRPGPRGWFVGWRLRLSRLPAWLRPPARVAELLVETGALYLVFRWAQRSLEEFLLVFAGIQGFSWIGRLLRPLTDRRPYVGGLLHAGAFTVTGTCVMGVLGPTDLASGSTWIAVSAATLVGGTLLGRWHANAQHEERRVLHVRRLAAGEPSDEPPDDDEERVVHIRPQDTSWRL